MKQLNFLLFIFMFLFTSVTIGFTSTVHKRNSPHGQDYINQLLAEGKKGNASAYTDLGEVYQYGDYGQSQDFKKAIDYYNKAIKAGDPRAYARLGIMYQRSEGVAQSHKKAFELYEKSANNGSPIGMSSLGIMYANGFGVKKDDKKAFELYYKSFYLGNARAALQLALAYSNGSGIEMNKQEAYTYYVLFMTITDDTQMLMLERQFRTPLTEAEENKAIQNARIYLQNFYKYKIEQK